VRPSPRVHGDSLEVRHDQRKVAEVAPEAIDLFRRLLHERLSLDLDVKIATSALLVRGPVDSERVERGAKPAEATVEEGGPVTFMTKTYGLDPVMAGPPELCDLPAS